MTESSVVYLPSPEFVAQANVGPEIYGRADADRLAWWAEQARRLDWETEFTDVLDWSNAPFAKWFPGGKLNVAYNCVDRHVEAGNGDRVAIHWEGEPVGDARDITYAQLKDEVCKAANALTDLGLVAGDRVAIYMPMVPEAVVAMLACARLGIMHSVVFGGYSASALRARIEDAEAKLVITTDGQYRRGSAVSLKAAVDEAVADQSSVKNVIVVLRTGIDVDWADGRDLWWHEIVGQASPEHTPEAFDSEHPLFLLYTSGSTGKPKGVCQTHETFIAAAQTIAPSLDAQTAMGMTAFAVLLLASLGLGLTFGALVYEPLDAALSAFSQRMTAKLFQPACNPAAPTSASIGRR